MTPDGTESTSSASSHADDDKDDPNQIDTIVLGDPADAPMPARHDHYVSPVHPTIVVRLSRFGDQTGLIPNSPAGHLLYGWLVAFNRTSAGGLAEALPSAAPEAATAVQISLRHKTGGFNLLSAKEVQPGLLVFRLIDQTPTGGEVLGTLQLRPDSSPAAIASRWSGSTTTQDRAGTRDIAHARVAFRQCKSVSVLIASFRSSIPRPPVPLFTLRCPPRGVQRKTRG